MSTYSNYSELELMGLLRKGDTVAFTEIYDRYWRKLLLIAWNLSDRSDHAKDLVHEVFMSLWERKDSIEIENLDAYLATAIKFSYFKYYQKEFRRKELTLQNYALGQAVNEQEQLDAIFLQEYINGIVEKMPEKCRLVFKYSRELGMKNAEIADEIKISEKGVEANLTRALKIIRNQLKDYGLVLLMFMHSVFSHFR